MTPVAVFGSGHRAVHQKGLHQLDVACRKCLRAVVAPPSNIDWSRPWHEILHASNCKVKLFFSSRTFFPRLSVALTILLGGLQAHDLARRTKVQGPSVLRKVGEVDWRKSVRRGFRQELALVEGIGINVVEIWCNCITSPRRVAANWGHGCMGQCGGPTCGESGRNAFLGDGWCLSGSGSCQVVDEGCGLLDQTAALVVEAPANLPARRRGWPS